MLRVTGPRWLPQSVLKSKMNPSASGRKFRPQYPKHRTALPHVRSCFVSVNLGDCRFDKLIFFLLIYVVFLFYSASIAAWSSTIRSSFRCGRYAAYASLCVWLLQSLRAVTQSTTAGTVTTSCSCFSFNRAAPKLCNRNMEKFFHKIVNVLRSGLELACGRGLYREPPFRASSSPTVRTRIRCISI